MKRYPKIPTGTDESLLLQLVTAVMVITALGIGMLGLYVGGWL